MNWRPLRLGAVTLLAAPLLALALTTQASADNCEKSRDYILQGMAGDLPRPAADYQRLFKACREALAFPNVKDAFVVKAGTVAIDPRSNTALATAGILAQFCQRFPRGSVRFLTAQEQHQARTVGLIVMIPAANPTRCQTVGGAT